MGLFLLRNWNRYEHLFHGDVINCLVIFRNEQTMVHSQIKERLYSQCGRRT